MHLFHNLMASMYSDKYLKIKLGENYLTESKEYFALFSLFNSVQNSTLSVNTMIVSFPLLCNSFQIRQCGIISSSM